MASVAQFVEEVIKFSISPLQSYENAIEVDTLFLLKLLLLLQLRNVSVQNYLAIKAIQPLKNKTKKLCVKKMEDWFPVVNVAKMNGAPDPIILILLNVVKQIFASLVSQTCSEIPILIVIC